MPIKWPKKPWTRCGSADIVSTMRQEEIWDADTAQRYDTPGSGMFAPEILEPTVDYLARLAGDGRALEFAIGTGRVAVPLAARGVHVTGIELSRPMVEMLRTKADQAAIPVVIGDMATARVPGEYTLVYLVYNTISNLLTQAEQVACFDNAARHLAPGGRFVDRVVGSRTAQASAGPASHRLPHRARIHRLRHLRRRAAARRLPPFPLR